MGNSLFYNYCYGKVVSCMITISIAKLGVIVLRSDSNEHWNCVCNYKQMVEYLI